MADSMCIGLVLYNPSESILNLIKSIASAEASIYIFDNSEVNRMDGLQSTYINYECAGKNMGLGYGLVNICRKAYNDGKESLIFFDQDSIFTSETIDYIKKFKEKNSYLKDKYSSITFNNKRKKPCSRDTILAINSGTLFFLKNLRRIGWHDASYFVDCVDYEYCFNARHNNFLLMEHSCAPGFDHLRSQDGDLINVFGRKFSLFRCYSSERIIGTIRGASRLLLASLRANDILFAFLILKFIIMYTIFQIAAFALKPFAK